MTVIELFTMLHPLIDFLGTICLIALAAAVTLHVIVSILQRIWRLLLVMGMFALILTAMACLL